MSSLRIGLCFSVEALDRQRSSADLTSINVLVFPELVDGGYAALSRGAAVHRMNDRLIGTFRDLSRANSLCCIAGSLRLGGRRSSTRSLPTNTSLVFDRGLLAGRYDKIHLFKPAHDDRYFSPGDKIRPFDIRGAEEHTGGGRDLLRSQVPGAGALAGARGIRILFVPARWPVRRDDAWRSLLKARAIENQIFVVGCNARGREGGFSYAFDPAGKEILSTRKNPAAHLAVAELDLKRIAGVKKLHDNLRDASFLRAHLVV